MAPFAQNKTMACGNALHGKPDAPGVCQGPLDSAPLLVTVRRMFSPGPGPAAQASRSSFGGAPSPVGRLPGLVPRYA